LEADVLGREPGPQQVRVHALELAQDRADVDRARRHLDRRQGLDRAAEGRGVHVRANAADALDQRDVLHPARPLRQELDAAEAVSDLDTDRLYGVAAALHADLVRLLERGVVRSDRNGVGHDGSVRERVSCNGTSAASRKNPARSSAGRSSGARFGWPENRTLKKSWISRSIQEAARTIGAMDGSVAPRVKVLKCTVRPAAAKW